MSDVFFDYASTDKGRERERREDEREKEGEREKDRQRERERERERKCLGYRDTSCLKIYFEKKSDAKLLSP